MEKLKGFFAVFGAALVVLTVGIVLKTQELQAKLPSGGRPVPVWITQPEQAAVHDLKGTLDIKAALITPKEILLFYAMQPRDNFKVTEFLVSGEEKQSRTLIAATQSLGDLAGFDVGVIRGPWTDQPGQAITLLITLSGDKGDGTSQQVRITPLRQLAPDPGKRTLQFLQFRNALSPIEAKLGFLGGDKEIAALELSSSEQDSSSVYLRIDSQANVTQITEAEYQALVAPIGNTVEGSSTSATPAPLEGK